jgi:hypothetical protein
MRVPAALAAPLFVLGETDPGRPGSLAAVGFFLGDFIN